MFRVNSHHRHLIGSFRISLFTVFHLFMLCGFALSNDQRVKLCADANCKGDLFPSNFIRAYDSGDSTFLKTKVNSPVKIVGFQFSERPDLLEAEDEEGKRGFIYDSHIDQTPYVIFLESALKKKQTFYMIERVGEWPKLIKEVAAVPELTRKYVTYARKLENYPLDKELLASFMELESQKNAKAHRHNHQQRHPQLNSNAEQPNVRNVQKVDATQNNGQLGRTDDEKGNTPISGEKGNQPENLMGQSKEFVIQDQSKESEKQAKVVSNPERQQQIADDNEPTPPPVTNNEIPANKNDLKSTDQTQTTSNLPEVNTQNEAEVRNVPSEKNENSITNKKITNPVQQRQQVQHKDPSQDNVQKLPLQHVNPPQSSQRADSPNPTNQETQSQHNIQPQQMAQPVNTNNKSDQNEQPAVEQPTNSNTNSPVGEQPTNSGTVEQPTNSGTNSPVPTNTGTNSPVPTNSGTNSPVVEQPTNSGTNSPVPTNTGTNSPVGEQPTNSGTVEQPTNSGTNSPVPTNTGTNSPVGEQPTNSNTNSPVPTNSGTNSPVVEQPTNSDINSKIQSMSQPDPDSRPFHPENPAQSQQNLEKTLVEENNLERPNSKSEETLSKDKANYQRQLDVDPLQQPREGSTTHNSDDVKTMQKSIENSTGTPTIEHPLPMQRSNSETTTSQEKEESAGKLKEERGLEDATRNDYKVNRGDNELERETAGGAEQSTNQAYCFKEDCQELDKQFSNSEQQHQQQPLSSSGASAPRRMFREWMAIGRNVLPEPLCHFEDTGLIVLAFVLLSAFVHLINCLLSSNSGPEPFDHRLLHDCITRLKEQELIIEKAKKNAAVNLHLAEAANAAEQLQKQNEALEQTLKTVEKRTLEFESENGKLKQLLKNTQYELEQSLALNTELKASVEMKDADLKKTESNQQRIESELSDVLSKLAQSRNREKYLEHDLNESHSQLERVKLELNEAQKEVLMKRNECAQKAAEIDELLGVVAELNKDNVDRRGKRRDNEEGKKKKQQSQKQSGDNSSSSAASSPGQPTPLLEAVELDPDNGAGSGGSAGWSDLGDGIEAPGAESESGGKLFDVLELAKLKSRLRSLEAERDQIKFALKVEHDEKENLLEEVARLRQDLVERKRDSEQRDLDRHGLTQQCTKLLQMMEEKVGESAKLMEEKEKKVERSEQEREKLRNRLSEVELGLLRVEDEKRELQHRIKELDYSLKQSNELNGQLENKHYHEERRLNTKIRQLDEQLANAKSSLSPLNVSGGGVSTDLNMSGNSSDREFVPVCSPDGGGARERSFVPSLWSEIDANEPVVEELVSRERKALASFRRRSIRSGDDAGEPNRESPFLADLVHVNKLGREERMNSSKYSSGASVRSSVAPRQRMRSRSAGRQSVARLTGIRPNLYGGTVEGSNRGTVDASFRASVVPYQNPSGKNSPYRQQERPQSSARLKNAVVGGLNVYSSDSNDAPSPPPEMPLLSGVPPPGLQKRPAVFVPAFKPNVQLHIPSTARK